MANLADQARELRAECEMFMKSPASLLMPASVRAMIRQLAAIVVALAEQQEKRS